MITTTDIERALQDICSVVQLNDGIRVTTHCMYPSSGLVRVRVRGGVQSVVVSDEGEAIGEASAAGIQMSNPDKLVFPLIKQRGLQVKNGVIYSPPTPIEATPVAILHVANVARDTANYLYDHGGLRRRQDFRRLLSQFLATSFQEQVSETRIVGASNKPHRFENVISFPNGRKLIVDAVYKDPSSINARVVANMDVRHAKNPTIEQRIVYDDSLGWSAADINLLQVGATVVPFSRAKEVIQRVAHQTRNAA